METLLLQDLLPIEDDDSEESAPDQEEDLIENKIEEENIQPALKLDYKLTTCEERAALVDKIVAQTPEGQLSIRYLEILGDYIMGAISKEEKRGRLYLTDNRLVTIGKRETSYEGLIEKFENGEDGIYNLISNDKNILLTPKNSITEEDIASVPGLRALREEIEQIEEAAKKATGRNKYLLKKQLIEMRKDQYILKSFNKPVALRTSAAKGLNKIDLESRYWLDDQQEPQSSGLISFFNEKHICAILCHYNALKNETKAKYFSDFYYLMEDFDKLMARALANEPLLSDIVQWKLDNKTNLEIRNMLLEKYTYTYTPEYISALWRNKIPKIIAQQAKIDFIIQHYETTEDAAWKKCSCCGQRKPAHHYFFSKNKTSKDGWYSVCKMCRNSKNKGQLK